MIRLVKFLLEERDFAFSKDIACFSGASSFLLNRMNIKESLCRDSKDEK